MKIIDLLNKIANGEEVPKKIKYNDEFYWYDETDDNEIARYRDVHDEWLFGDAYLNDEVEILEEEKKIPEKLEKKLIYAREPDGFEHPDSELPSAEEMFKKINEICNYLKSKGE